MTSPISTPPVGKSGPLSVFTNSGKVIDGFSRYFIVAASAATGLCGAIDEVNPTAIPVLTPLISSAGKSTGKIFGRRFVPE